MIDYEYQEKAEHETSYKDALKRHMEKQPPTKMDIEAKILFMLRSMSDKERMEILDSITDNFCIHCGTRHGEVQRCQCWNDE